MISRLPSGGDVLDVFASLYVILGSLIGGLPTLYHFSVCQASGGDVLDAFHPYMSYGVATISRLLQIIGLFSRI